MKSELLTITELDVSVAETPLLYDIELSIAPGTCHVLMGPNGAGKSTLGHTIMGNPAYTITRGTIMFAETDITHLRADARSQAGIYLSFQTPLEVPGITLYAFLRAIAAKHPDIPTRAREFRSQVEHICEQLDIDTAWLSRDLNVGFSGGEKKKVEMLQLLLLKPKLAILDETDSGLDVDALTVVSKGIKKYRSEIGGSLLVITHDQKILRTLDVNHTHVIIDGRIVANGDAGLIEEILTHGFEHFKSTAPDNESVAPVLTQRSCA